MADELIFTQNSTTSYPSIKLSSDGLLVDYDYAAFYEIRIINLLHAYLKALSKLIILYEFLFYKMLYYHSNLLKAYVKIYIIKTHLYNVPIPVSISLYKLESYMRTKIL